MTRRLGTHSYLLLLLLMSLTTLLLKSSADAAEKENEEYEGTLKKSIFSRSARVENSLEMFLGSVIAGELASCSLGVMWAEEVEEKEKGDENDEEKEMQDEDEDEEEKKIKNEEEQCIVSAVNIVLASSNPRQTWTIRSPRDYERVGWGLSGSGGCRGYIFLFPRHSTHAAHLLAYTSRPRPPWDYSGRYLVAGLTETQVKALMRTQVGRKIEHLVGLVQVAGGWDVYTNQLFREPPERRIARWRNQGEGRGGRSIRPATTLFPPKLTNLEGAELKVAWFPFSPHFMVGGGGRRYGRDYRVVMALSSALNFTPVFRQPADDQLWGQALANGSWTGLVGSVSRGEVNFGVANVFLANPDGRRAVQDFSSFYDSDVACFMGRTASPLPRWQSLSLPFTWLTWLTVIVSFVFTCVSLFTVTSLSRKRDHTLHSPVNMSTIILYTWGILTRMPLVGVVKGAGVRLAFMAVWVYALVLTIAYCAHLTASLTVVKMQPAVDTFSGLRQSGQPVFAMGTFFQLTMAISENPDLKVLAGRLVPLPDLTSALRPVERGEGVFIQSRKYLEFLVSDNYSPRGTPTMRILKECFAPFSIAVSLEQNSPFRRSLDGVLRRVFEGGLVRHWFVEALRQARRDKKQQEEDKAEGRGKEEEEEEVADVVPLRVDHLQGVFLLLSLVLLVACLVFMTELWCWRKKLGLHRIT